MTNFLIPLFALQLLLSNMDITSTQLHSHFVNETKDDNELSVKFKGQNITKGSLMIAIYSESKGFLGDKPLYHKRVRHSELNQNAYTFSLPTGTYAIAAYHDQNDNNELDRNIFQYPTEPYGFSNDARGTLGPPSFESASFRIEGKMEIEISLN